MSIGYSVSCGRILVFANVTLVQALLKPHHFTTAQRLIKGEYLEPNRNSLQKTVEGLLPLCVFLTKKFNLHKKAP